MTALPIRIVGLAASVALAVGVFGNQMASASYDRPFSLSFQLVFCAGALVSAVAFLRGAYFIGAVVGAGASAVSILLYFATRKALAEVGISRAAHPGWGFILTMPAIAGFLLVLAWYEVRTRGDALP